MHPQMRDVLYIVFISTQVAWFSEDFSYIPSGAGCSLNRPYIHSGAGSYLECPYVTLGYIGSLECHYKPYGAVHYMFYRIVIICPQVQDVLWTVSV
jgi:hypothetical protein